MRSALTSITHIIAAAAGAVVASATLSAPAAAQGCVLTTAQPIRVAKPNDAKEHIDTLVRLSEFALRGEPNYATVVPTTDPTVACLVQVNPGPDQRRFHLTLRVSFGGRGANEIKGGMDSTQVFVRSLDDGFVFAPQTDIATRTGVDGLISIPVVMHPRDTASRAASYNVAVRLRAPNRTDTVTFPFVIQWAPPVTISLRSREPRICDAPICAPETGETFVAIRTTPARELQLPARVQVRLGTGNANAVNLEQRGDTIGFTIKDPGRATQVHVSEVPLLVARHFIDNNNALKPRLTLETSEAMKTYPLATGTLTLYADATQRPLPRLWLANGAQRVFVADTRLEVAKDYRLVDAQTSDTTAPIAMLRLDTPPQGQPAAAIRAATLTPMRATPFRGGQAGAVRVWTYVGQTAGQPAPDIQPFALEVRASPLIAGAATQMSDGTWRDGIHLRPLRKKQIFRITGTNVTNLENPRLVGATFQKEEGPTSPDTAVWRVTTDTTVTAGTPIRFTGPIGDQSYAVALLPNSEAVNHLRFLTLEAEGRVPQALPLGQTSFKLKQPGTIVLRPDLTAIEGARDTALFGVQYLTLTLTVRDQDRAVQQTKTLPCVAFVPPSVNGVPYGPDADCPRFPQALRVADSLTKISDADWHWTVELDARHAPARHRGASGAAAQLFTHQQWRPRWEIKTTFPTGAVAFQEGEDPDAVLSFVSTQLGVSFPLFKPEIRLGFHGGLGMINVTDQSKSSAALSPILSMTFMSRIAGQTIDLGAAITRPFTGSWCYVRYSECRQPWRLLIGPGITAVKAKDGGG